MAKYVNRAIEIMTTRVLRNIFDVCMPPPNTIVVLLSDFSTGSIPERKAPTGAFLSGIYYR
jgi:hypothetical protein